AAARRVHDAVERFVDLSPVLHINDDASGERSLAPPQFEREGVVAWDDQANDCTMLRNVSFVALDLLSLPECDALIAALRRAAEDQAPVYGLGERAAVHPLARRTTRLAAPSETRQEISSI